MAKAEELRDLITRLVEGLRERLGKDPNLIVEGSFPAFGQRIEAKYIETFYSPEAPRVFIKYKYSPTQTQEIIRLIDHTKLASPLDEYYDRAVGIIVDRILSTSARRYWYKEEDVRRGVSFILDVRLLEAAEGKGPELLPDLLARWYDESGHPSWSIHCYLSGLRVDVENGIELKDGELTAALRRPTLTDIKELLEYEYPFNVPPPVFEALSVEEESSEGEESGGSVKVEASGIISAVLELRGSGNYEDYHLRELAEDATWRLMAALALLGNCWPVAKDQHPSFFYGALALDNASIFGGNRFWLIPPQGVLSADPEVSTMLSHLVYNQCRVTEDDVGRMRELWGYLTKEYEVAVPLSTALKHYLESIQVIHNPVESTAYAVMAMEAIYGRGRSGATNNLERYAARLLKALGEKVECLRQWVGNEKGLRNDLDAAYEIRSRFAHGDIGDIDDIKDIDGMKREAKKAIENDKDFPERVKEYARLSILALLLLGADRGGDFKKAKEGMLELIEKSLLAPERLDELWSDQFLQRMRRLACAGGAPSPTV